ncbi:MAG: twin-arginine translocase TatA/TatE family subunit [Candidatus Binataceae bacterium]|nr:twin-arginine translocase TatA/TatE family subunit [Candidatus Binataceae bacterium]
MSIVEIGIVLVVALIVIGPEKLPEVLVTVGRLMRELRLASNTVMRELTSTVDDMPDVLKPYRAPSPELKPPPQPVESSKPAEATNADEPKPPSPAV